MRLAYLLIFAFAHGSAQDVWACWWVTNEEEEEGLAFLTTRVPEAPVSTAPRSMSHLRLDSQSREGEKARSRSKSQEAFQRSELYQVHGSSSHLFMYY